MNDSISKNDFNVIQVSSSSTISTVTIPFSVIDNSIMDGTKSVSLNVSILENKDILDKLKKGVKKVFTFDLVV